MLTAPGRLDGGFGALCQAARRCQQPPFFLERTNKNRRHFREPATFWGHEKLGHNKNKEMNKRTECYKILLLLSSTYELYYADLTHFTCIHCSKYRITVIITLHLYLHLSADEAAAAKIYQTNSFTNKQLD